MKKAKCDGEPCTVRLVLYCPITHKAQVLEVKHGGARGVLGMDLVFVDRFCADIKGCDFCTALAARMLSRTDALAIARALGFSIGGNAA